MAPRSLELGPLELQILGLLSNKEPKGVSTIQGELKAFGNDLALKKVTSSGPKKDGSLFI
jgi:hypothetical protein